MPVVGEMLGLDRPQNGHRTAGGRALQERPGDADGRRADFAAGHHGARVCAAVRRDAEAVADAIFEHYLPRYQGDALPQSRAGLALGLANRLDSLVGLFAVGFAPTGSADPFGLRREALGVAQALIGSEQPFDLRQALRWRPSCCRPPARRRTAPARSKWLVTDVLAFIRDRLYGLLRDEGLAHDVVSAVLAEQSCDPYWRRAGGA